VRVFPDSALLRIQTERAGVDDLTYTIIRNRAHLNIDFMFLENSGLVAAEDTLHLVRGIATSRPNFFFSVASEDSERFVNEAKSLSTAAGAWDKFLDRYGARRSDPLFWTSSDFFNAAFRKLDPINSGILDLSRYAND
jgi:hypothetical protein